MLAKDIVVATEDDSINELAFRLHNLAYQCEWWKRFSIYSAVGVKEVKIDQFQHILNIILSTGPADVLSPCQLWYYQSDLIVSRPLQRAFDH